MVMTICADFPVSRRGVKTLTPGSPIGEAWPKHLFTEALEQGRHRPQPQRIQQDEMLGAPNRVLRVADAGRHDVAVKLLFAAQQRESALLMGLRSLVCGIEVPQRECASSFDSNGARNRRSDRAHRRVSRQVKADAVTRCDPVEKIRSFR